MESMKTVNLKLCSGQPIYYNQQTLLPYQKEIEDFLVNEDYMNTLSFAKHMMMAQEIKCNNRIAGIDNLSDLDKIIKNLNIPLELKQRIIGLYSGYQYILENKMIDEDHLNELYLKFNIDEKYQTDNESKSGYYRSKPVYILKGNCVGDHYFKGIAPDQIKDYMKRLFYYIDNEDENCFLKSQIVHFYFVYIHPYYDLNGRISRALSMWYLLNNESYPFTIFNKAVAFSKRRYEQTIITTRENGDITVFLKNMLIQVKRELEKEYIIHSISQKTNVPLSKQFSQLVDYLLMMKGNITAKDFVVIYNNYNVSKPPEMIVREQIIPLIEQGIILDIGKTKGFISRDFSNMNLAINPDMIDIDRSKIKYLQLERFIANRK